MPDAAGKGSTQWRAMAVASRRPDRRIIPGERMGNGNVVSSPRGRTLASGMWTRLTALLVGEQIRSVSPKTAATEYFSDIGDSARRNVMAVTTARSC